MICTWFIFNIDLNYSKLYDQLDSMNFNKNYLRIDQLQFRSSCRRGISTLRQEVDAPKMEMYSLGKDPWRIFGEYPWLTIQLYVGCTPVIYELYELIMSY